MADIQQTHFFNLPTHIITDIFQLLPRKDLLQCTTVCKYFNNIISNSQEVLMKLPVYLSNRGTVRDLTCHRKYSYVRVSTNKFKKSLSFIESLADNIVKFRISNNGQSLSRQNFSFNDLIGVLRKMPKLRQLFIKLPHDFNEGFSENTPRLALKLDFLGGMFHPDLWPLFFNCSVKHCLAVSLSGTSRNFIEFLKRHNELEDLYFGSNDREPLNVDSLLNVKFRLKRLAMIFNRANNVDYLAKFLLQFRQSLECLHLIINDERIWRILPQFEKLKTLVIRHSYPLESYGDIVIPNITRVLIENKIHPSLPIMFPNITTIEIKNPTDIDALCQFTKLESITVCDNIQTEISRSSAKKLTIIHHDADQRPFDYDNHNFEKVYVTKSNEETPRWLKEFIDGGYAASLKIFSVIRQKNVDRSNI